jgi:hypothetical protein
MLTIYRLPNQLPDEKIIKVFRRDYFIMFKKILLFALFAVLLVVAGIIVLAAIPNILAGGISYPLIVLGTSGYLLFIWLFFFFSFIDYYLDVWIITNYRIIDISQEGFFARTISEQYLEKIQDITSEVKGFFPTVFKYGNVYIQTAAEVSRFFMLEVPNPEKIRDIIIKMAEERKYQRGNL